VNLAECRDIDGNGFSSIASNPTKVVFTLSSEIMLTEDEQYATVVSWPINGDEGNQLRWVNGWDTYIGGKLIEGTSSGQGGWETTDYGNDAYFEIWDIEHEYSFTIITVGNGNVTPGNQTYLSGTNININAINAAGWSFAGWSGDCTGNTNTTIIMDSDKTVTATFTQNAIPEMPSNVMFLLLIAMTLGIALIVKKRSIPNQ
jgi:uncharacterized repeat protein (TIGR02543 family)